MYQPSTSNTSRRILVVLALLLFIVALILVIVQSLTGGTGNSLLKTYDQGYKDGFNEARSMAQDFGIQQSSQRTSLSGTITEINGNKLTIDASGLFLNDRVDDVGTIRTIVTDENTVITALEEKPASELETEQHAYDREIASFKPSSDSPPPIPPSPQQESSISLSDLAVGDIIDIKGGEGENLLPLKTITASSIRKHQRQEVPNMPEPEPVNESMDETE